MFRTLEENVIDLAVLQDSTNVLYSCRNHPSEKGCSHQQLDSPFTVVANALREDTDVCAKTLRQSEPLPCDQAAETALYPLI